MTSRSNRNKHQRLSMPARARLLSISRCLVVLGLCFSGCSKEMLKSLGELAQLRQQLMDEYHEQNIDVVLQDSRTLGVTFLNSALNDRNFTERATRAEKTALFVKKHFAGMNQIERIWVSFVVYKTRFVIFNYSQGLDVFLFDKDAKPIGPSNDPTAHGNENRATAAYNSKQNETQVQITRLLLEGDLDNGLALIPHFTVRGDATAPHHKLPPPKSVTFEFASFAPKKVFNNDPKIVITGDGKTIFSDKARNLSAPTENKSGNEFLSLEIPFAQFWQMTKATKVKLQLGSRDYPLTNTQLGEMRAMANYTPLSNQSRQ
jgi:hypothetical protein